MTRINTPNTTHLYEIRVDSTTVIEVEANNRSQAARIAEQHGYAVLSVNMVG